MEFLKRLGKLFSEHMAYTVILVLGLILFLYFADGDLIGGIFTAVCALIVYVCVVLLYGEYKKMPKTVAKTVTKKAPAKKAAKKSNKK